MHKHPVPHKSCKIYRNNQHLSKMTINMPKFFDSFDILVGWFYKVSQPKNCTLELFLLNLNFFCLAQYAINSCQIWWIKTVLVLLSEIQNCLPEIFVDWKGHEGCNSVHLRFWSMFLKRFLFNHFEWPTKNYIFEWFN